MSDDNLRFPSGVTVQQAKKDAKKEAKTQGIPVSQSLDEMANRLGLAMPWSKAVNLLRKRGAPLVKLNLPLKEPASWSVSVYADAPLITIIGATGTGKSVAALWLANQAISQGLPVQHISMSEISKPGGEWFQQDLAAQMIHGLRESYPDQFELHEFPYQGEKTPFSALPKPREKAFYIVDEVALVTGGPDSLPKLLKWIAAFNGILCICSQTSDSDLATISWGAEKPPVGLALFGSLMPARSKDPNMERFIQLTRGLEYQRGEYSEMVAADVHRDWANIMRLAIPPQHNE